MCLLALPVSAQQTDKQAARAQEQVRRLRQQVQETQQTLQKVEQEKAELAQKLAKAEAELGSFRTRTQDGARRLTAASERVTTLETEREVLAAQLAAADQQAAQMRKRQAASDETLASRELSLSLLEVRMKADAAERQRCEANNLALYTYGRELLAAYRDKGVLASISQRDPVFNLGSVKIENILEEYRDKLDAQRLALPPTAAGKPDASSATR